jgi:carbon storage regulator
MLILSRKPGESIIIDGRIVVKIVRLDGDLVKLGIDAPPEIAVHRQEVYDEIQRNNQDALVNEGLALPRLSPQKSPPQSSKDKSTLAASPSPRNPDHSA